MPHLKKNYYRTSQPLHSYLVFEKVNEVKIKTFDLFWDQQVY